MRFARRAQGRPAGGIETPPQAQREPGQFRRAGFRRSGGQKGDILLPILVDCPDRSSDPGRFTGVTGLGLQGGEAIEHWRIGRVQLDLLLESTALRLEISLALCQPCP